MNMKKLLYLFLSCTLLFCSTACHPDEDETHHYKMYVINDSDKGLFIDYSCSKYDTVYTTNGSFDPDECLLSKETTYLSVTSRTSWENFFARPDNDTLHLYLLDADLVSIQMDKSIMARYDLSLQDLQHLDWQISFPPTEAMKNIHMWPSFETIIEKYHY